MNFDYKDIILSHEIIAESNGIKVRYNETTIKGIINVMEQDFDGRDFHPGVYEKAAILFEHIIRFHPFMDGNKRTAMFSMKVFLRNEGIIFISFPSDVRFLISVAQNCNLESEDIARLTGNIQRWISAHCVKANDVQGINRIIERNIKILDTVKDISYTRDKPDILSHSINYWLVEEVYPDNNINYEDLINEHYELMKFVNKV